MAGSYFSAATEANAWPFDFMSPHKSLQQLKADPEAVEMAQKRWV